MQNLRSSFFYFFFAIIGGTFASVLQGLYYARRLRTGSEVFLVTAFLLGLIGHIEMYSSLARKLPAPFYLRDFLNQPNGAMIGSLLGLTISFLHLIVLRKRQGVDLLPFVENEWPVVPNLLCCAIGALINITIVSSIYWYYN